jgi:hypothetical protein
MMAHGSRMIDWEDLAQRQIVEIQRALPESIRARATEVPVFFSRARNGKGGTCLGVFEGYSLMEGPPAQPDEMPRITLFIDTLAQAANQRRIKPGNSCVNDCRSSFSFSVPKSTGIWIVM